MSFHFVITLGDIIGCVAVLGLCVIAWLSRQ